MKPIRKSIEPHPAQRRGLALVEVSISTLLVGLMVVTSLKAVGAVFQTWQVTEQQFDGAALAREMMTEVLQSRYEEPDDTPTYGLETSEAVGDRTNWDDTDDYDDWSASPPEAKNGAILSNFTGWTRSVVVQKLNPSSFNPLNDNAPDTDLRPITVTVTDPQARQNHAGGRSLTVGSCRAGSLRRYHIRHLGWN